MRGTVVAGDAGAVDDEGDRCAVERCIAGDLVEGALQERRIDAHHRPQAAQCQAGGEGDRVLLGDADVEEALRVAAGELQQTGRRRHRRGDRADPRIALRGLDQGLAEEVGPRRRLGRRRAGGGGEGGDAVEAIDGVVLAGAASAAEATSGPARPDAR